MNPYIVSSLPSGIKVQNVGDSVKLNCSARGLPLPKVKWFKDGSIISTASNEENDLIETEFGIHHFKPSDAGTYTCMFENDKNGTAENNTVLSTSKIYFFSSSSTFVLFFSFLARKRDQRAHFL